MTLEKPMIGTTGVLVSGQDGSPGQRALPEACAAAQPDEYTDPHWG
jgi:hypothetical protein